ncbi:MAG: hypothetical protein ACXU95_10905, partial [Isosphaeraceae bacterium]
MASEIPWKSAQAADRGGNARSLACRARIDLSGELVGFRYPIIALLPPSVWCLTQTGVSVP